MPLTTLNKVINLFLQGVMFLLLVLFLLFIPFRETIFEFIAKDNIFSKDLGNGIITLLVVVLTLMFLSLSSFAGLLVEALAELTTRKITEKTSLSKYRRSWAKFWWQGGSCVRMLKYKNELSTLFEKDKRFMSTSLKTH